MRAGSWRWVGNLCVSMTCACGPLGSAPSTAVDDDGAVSASPGDTPASAEAGSSTDIGDGGTRVASMTASDSLCERRSVQAQRIAPDMLIVLDRSLSMAPDANATSTDRWQGSVAAINQTAAVFDGTINFGLMTFPAFDSRQRLPAGSTNVEIQCPTGTLDVALGPSRAVQIAETLEGSVPGGSTPTGPTLMAALEVLRGAARLYAGTLVPRYVLLVTDGDPNCAGPPAFDGSDPLARRQALDAVEALNAAQIKTYVVGFQTAGTTFVDQLDEMAALGGTGEAIHRSVESGADLARTFQEIADSAVSCSFKLEASMVDPSYVLIKTAGQPRAFQNQNGWRLEVDKKTVTLTGAACDSVRSGASITVEVQCTPVVLL